MISLYLFNFSHGDFVTILDLPEGEHEYKFLIDGEWKYDPNEPTKENAQGITNNVITVKKTDFEVFDALDVDSNTSSTNTTNESSKYKYKIENSRIVGFSIHKQNT